MKKILIAIFIPVFLFVMTGCGSSEVENTMEGAKVDYVGTLKSLGEISVEGKADHILETAGEDVYYVYSEFLDLDKAKYRDARVQIIGEVVSVTESGKEIIAIKSIIPISRETVEEDSVEETPKKYQNLELGFRIENMIAWKFVSDEGGKIEFEKDGAKFTLSRHENGSASSLDEWLILNEKSNTSPTLLGPDSLKSYLVEEEGVFTYFVSRTDEFIYEISGEYPSYNLKNELLTIVNSFRFVPMKEVEKIVEEEAADADYALAKAYFNKNLNDLTPDYGGSNYIMKRLEFSVDKEENSFVYIVYEDDKSEYMALFEYEVLRGGVVNVVTHGYFTPGVIVDWDLKDGEDLAKGREKTIIYNDEAPVVTVEEGYRLFESGPFDFTVQYPSNWYVQGQGGKYLFNDAPLDGTYLMYIEVQKKKMSDVIADIPFSFESTDLVIARESFIARPIKDKDGLYIVSSRNDGDEAYVLWAEKTHESILIKMANRIVD
ncbi:hypothetical protein HOG48_01740 [Candidatus Peregrinibacteria bacterium]|jgi:hypothetical protein|nr:hypothetical protein [Candidatus Peregrinibacteria bacterium]